MTDEEEDDGLDINKLSDKIKAIQSNDQVGKVDTDKLSDLDKKIADTGTNEHFIGFKNLLANSNLSSNQPSNPPINNNSNNTPPAMNPNLAIALKRVQQESALQKSITSKLHYAQSNNGVPLIGSAAGLVPYAELQKAGITAPPGSSPMGISADDLTPDEMSWLINKRGT